MKRAAEAELVFVTSNKDKLREAREILGRPVNGIELELEELQSGELRPVVIHKAEQAHRALGRPLLVEDTALAFDAWEGLPGPFIKHFLTGLGPEGLALALTPFNNPAARALCGVGYHDGQRIHYFEGVTEGTIVNPRGEQGFGWDPIFQPQDKNQTFAEMTPTQKNQLSMRAKALKKLADFLIG